MRVLLIDVNCKYSSTGKIVYSLFQKLKADGHEAAICYGRGVLIKEPGIYKFGLDWETLLHVALARITGLNGYYSYITTKRLIAYIDDFQPDVIHIHELHAYFINIKMLIEHIKKLPTKVIWTFHCEYMYTGKCGHTFECERYQYECGDCPLLDEYPASFFFDRTRKMLSDKKKYLNNFQFTIITPSQWLFRKVKSSFLKNKPMKIIHNGIDTQNIFYPREEKELVDIRRKYKLINKKIILSVAPNIMSDLKGGQTILEISRRFKDDNFIFVLVGAKKTECYGHNVLLVSRTKNQNELANWYSIADIFLICSKKENFPTTCLEALACGLPIVGIDSGGTRETVPEPYGVFIKETDVVQLQDAIIKQIEKKYSKTEIRKFALNLYSNDAMYKEYLKVYSQY